MVNEQAKSDQIQEIGQMILTSEKIARLEDWHALSIVVTLREGRGGNVHGFFYRQNGEFGPTTPGKPKDTVTAFHTLRNIMEEETGDKWHQALVQLTRPGPEINIKFEYDDPQRWKPEISGLDMSDYANSIKPTLN